MQIHELNNFTGTLGAGAYLAVDDGNDTGKLSTQQLLATTEARIDNIIAGPAPSAEEIVDARYGADGVTYPSLGDAIRDQVTDLKSDLDSVYSIPEDGNFFNPKTAIPNKDINSSTGALVDDSRYGVSGKIYMDFTQRVYVLNSSYNYVYCYAANNAYLGRLNTHDSSSAPATVYPSVSYVRVLYKMTDNNMMLMYHKYVTSTAYKEFLPIGGWTDKTVTEHNYPADAKAVRENFVAINPRGGNLFDYDTRIENTSPDSTTGALRSDTGYFCSQKIYIDGASKVFIKGSTATTNYQYAYCYKADDTFLGRYNCNSGTVLNTATGDTVAYIRVIGMMATDNRIQVLQISTYFGDQYRPYSEIANYMKPLESKKIRVANYNTGDFTGVGISRHSQESIDTYRKEVQTFDADLITYEYDIANVNDISAYTNILARWLKTGTQSGTSDYNYYAIRSMFDVISTEKVNYTITSAVTPTHTSFLATVFLINFIPICVVALHVDWKDKTLRGEQLDSVVAYCEAYDNVIITGDFNPEDYVNGVKQSNNLTYEDLDRFIEAGYTPLNANSDLLGVVPTLASDTQIGAWDNILIKGADIKPCSFGTFAQKEWMNDHLPIYADLIIG